MPFPHFEVPSGVIDGANLVFNVSQAYKPGTPAVFLNGLLLRADYTDGWAESNPATGEITMKEPPRVTKVTPDVVQVFYIDLSPAALETVIVCHLAGRLRAMESLEGYLIPLESLRGTVGVSGDLEGHLEPTPPIHGELVDGGVLHGRLEAVC